MFLEPHILRQNFLGGSSGGRIVLPTSTGTLTRPICPVVNLGVIWLFGFIM